MSSHAKHFGYTEDEYLLEDLRALWAVRVLDAWSDANPDREAFVTFKRDTHETDTAYVSTSGYNTGDQEIAWFGSSADAARLAAAEAVLPTLDEAVRAKLGERP